MERCSDGPIGIAGGGRVGQALGRLLFERRQPVTAVACRRSERASLAASFIGPGVTAVTYEELPGLISRVLITVPDRVVAEVAEILAVSGMDRGLALHTSGALGPEALSALSGRGVACAVLHPLQTIPSPELGRTALTGISFGITGDGPAAAWGEQIAESLNSRSFRIAPEARALYHAAAVMASNYLVSLIDAAAALMTSAGVDRDHVLDTIAPIVEASVGNALRIGPERAITGPICRGDLETVRRHLAALASSPASVRALYRAAGLHTVDLALRSGLSEDAAHQVGMLLREGGE